MTWHFNTLEPMFYDGAQLAEYLDYPNLQAFEHAREDGRIPPADIKKEGVEYWNATTAKRLKEEQLSAIKQAWGYKPEGER